MLFEELISKTENEIMRMSPLTWAYVGDSIYEVYVRTSVTELIEYKDNEIFYNYLKKYMHPMENIENEIEFNINESQNNKKNGDISNSQNENIQSDNGYEVEDNYDDIEELNI